MMWINEDKNLSRVILDWVPTVQGYTILLRWQLYFNKKIFVNDIKLEIHAQFIKTHKNWSISGVILDKVPTIFN